MMCRKPLPVKLIKITVFVVFFCFAECAAGSCLSYGHACWGAHGKRDGGRQEERNTQWFLAKLLENPLDSRYLKEMLTNQQQLIQDAQIDALKGSDYLVRSNLEESLPNENVVSSEDIYPNHHSNRIKQSRRFEKRSTRMMV